MSSRPSSKYPLKPLLEHRDRLAEDATAELAGSVRAREAAASAKARIDEAVRAVEERARATRNAEAERLVRGELRAVDLARASSFGAAVDDELRGLLAERARADERLAAAARSEAEARARLAATKADRDVVARDEARFEDRARRAALAADEENAADAWAGRRKA